MDTMSHAAIHRLAVREIDRQLLARELARIDAATHVAATGPAIYCYGDEAACRDFATGLRRVEVRAITDRDRAELARHKRTAYAVSPR